MTRTTECERTRLQMMEAMDGESVQRDDDRQHIERCSSCRQWLEQLESVGARLATLTYPASGPDLWAGIETSIVRLAEKPLSRRLLLIASLLGLWRAVELLVDVPLPMLHPLVPLAALVAASCSLAGDPLAIETLAPELRSEAPDGRA